MAHALIKQLSQYRMIFNFKKSLTGLLLTGTLKLDEGITALHGVDKTILDAAKSDCFATMSIQHSGMLKKLKDLQFDKDVAAECHEILQTLQFATVAANMNVQDISDIQLELNVTRYFRHLVCYGDCKFKIQQYYVVIAANIAAECPEMLLTLQFAMVTADER
ncbi:uncharacterized protein LOC135201918 [Macrobrachium nipponense]|uniref:uncharacterized protein LOC135201918 n=1 Tax=Macrobrachium nipponense TaxID=159736 RepID=UPI0030C8D0C8